MSDPSNTERALVEDRCSCDMRALMRSEFIERAQPLGREHPCPCMSGQSLDRCCASLLRGGQQADSPERLMRARYCAFYLGLPSFLEATDEIDWRAGASEWSSRVSARARGELESKKWLSLHIHQDHLAERSVTFTALCVDRGGGRHLIELHERSEFEPTGLLGWTYIRGDARWTPLEIGRNAPCPCRSGKKWKRCCGRV